MSKICTQCGYIGRPKKVAEGNMALLLLLLGAIVFWPLIIVFVLYLMFRSKKEVCPKCSGNMIDENSPLGKRLKL